MQTSKLINVHLPIVLTDIVMDFLKMPKDKMTSHYLLQNYHIAQNGFYEECLEITNPHFGLSGAIAGQHENIVELMISRGAKVIPENFEIACRFQNIKVVEMLRHKLKPQDLVVLNRNACAENACRYGNNEILIYVLNYIETRNIEKYVDIVCEMNNEDKANILLSKSTKYYVNFKATLQVQLHKACSRGFLKIAQLIHEHAERFSHKLDWTIPACVALTDDVLMYALQNEIYDYDKIFQARCVDTFGKQSGPFGKLKLLMPFLSLNQLHSYMETNDDMRELITQELLKRALNKK